jgi:hypothetical protein
MTAGYSGTPLPRKLGLDGKKNLFFDHAPNSVLKELGFKVAPRPKNSSPLDFGLVFTKSQGELKEKFQALVPRLDPAATLWISWPKKTSGVATDLNENIVRELGLAAGLVDVKVCAIDDTWAGLKFVFRLKDRAKQAKGRV